MDILHSSLEELDWYSLINSNIREGSRPISECQLSLSGIDITAKAHIISGLSISNDIQSVIVVPDDAKAREMMEVYSFFDKNVKYFPPRDLIFFQADISGNQLLSERMSVLESLIKGEKFTLITTLDGLMGQMAPADEIKNNYISIGIGDIIDEAALVKRLVRMGYVRNSFVTCAGEFSVRGGIIDIFSLTEENPVRIELWGDSVESVRSFDIYSQRSIENLKSVDVAPSSELLLSPTLKEAGFHSMLLDANMLEKQFKAEDKNEYAARVKEHIEKMRVELLETDLGINLESYIGYFYEKPGFLFDFFDRNKTVFFFSEPARIIDSARLTEMEFTDSMTERLKKGYCFPGQLSILKSVDETVGILQRYRFISLSLMEEVNDVFSYSGKIPVTAKNMSSFNGSLSLLINDLKKRKKTGNRIVIVSPSRTRAKRLADELNEEQVYAAYTDNYDHKLEKGQIFTIYGHLKNGFEYPEIGLMVISEDDIFGHEKERKKRKPKYGGGKKISGYGELKAGDYVIHEDHGLGVYKGIEKVEVDHVTKDYMKIEYKDGGNLYVLASNFDAVQLYADSAAKAPKLNKLGTNEWSKTKTKVQTAVSQVAKELVNLYALRQEKNGYCYGKDTVWQKEFEECFPYEETEDQLNAIEATKDDMESTKIMDRLICGDVGFGKTEIAIRAAFKAVQDGKQVAYLVPTTILAQQHFNTFKERMSEYPVKVGMLSRFCSSKEIKSNLEELKKGSLDIVVGTHRMLSKDVCFKDLGLLIIDEEQRFGVTHKEKIKMLKENVDVLTLTATPIPRTLHMSLVGIRDMSILEEPPMDRLPIQTFVCEYNEEMVREAIQRELNRNGQVYYVYNRVGDIDRITEKLQMLLPSARIAFAHGQMKESELEVIMMEFVNHEIDVLVSTTIIETGLDIPNVNTMIIHDSDSMGLSQLYQLRGRVGRSNRTSFAFLMYQKNKLLKEVAEKRLAAIKEFTELGSGFKIAMRDLEIRGAGNLLGKMQHGHMEAVGYELYCKMLEEAISEEQGKKTVVNNTVTVDIDVDAFIPAEYIVNETQKLDIYKRIADIRDQADYDDMTDEMTDRFGRMPKEAVNLLKIAILKHKAKLMGIKEFRGRIGNIRVVMNRVAPVRVANIPVFLNEYMGKMKFIPQGDPTFILKYDIEGLVEKDEEILLEKSEQLVNSFYTYLYDDES